MIFVEGGEGWVPQVVDTINTIMQRPFKEEHILYCLESGTDEYPGEYASCLEILRANNIDAIDYARIRAEIQNNGITRFKIKSRITNVSSN